MEIIKETIPPQNQRGRCALTALSSLLANPVGSLSVLLLRSPRSSEGSAPNTNIHFTPGKHIVLP